MDRLLARLERRYGRYAVEHLSWVIVGGMAAVFVLSLASPGFLRLLTLDLGHVLRGQVWRLVTYLFIPQTMSRWWIVFSLYWVWMLGNQLEQTWGAFRFNVFYLLGMFGTTLAAAVSGAASGNEYLNMSMLFAFATLYPDYEILLLVLPLRIKYLAWITAALVGYAFLSGDWATKGAIAASFGNYFLFFGGHLLALAKQRRRGRSAPAERSGAVSLGQRSCALCGAREAEGADIRVCSCEKCGGPRSLCLQHARNH